jgi:hypothetical protein
MDGWVGWVDSRVDRKQQSNMLRCFENICLDAWDRGATGMLLCHAAATGRARCTLHLAAGTAARVTADQHRRVKHC